MIRKLVAAYRLVNRQSSDRLVSIAQRGMKRPTSLTITDIRSVCGSVLSQAKGEQ